MNSKEWPVSWGVIPRMASGESNADSVSRSEGAPVIAADRWQSRTEDWPLHRRVQGIGERGRSGQSQRKHS